MVSSSLGSNTCDSQVSQNSSFCCTKMVCSPTPAMPGPAMSVASTHGSSSEGELVWSRPHCSCLEASNGRIHGGVHENGARALDPSGGVSWGMQSHHKAGAVGCSERGGFDGQSSCPIPLPVGDAAGGPGRCPEGCPSCVATKVWGAHGKKPGRVMLEPEGCWRSLPRSCLLPLQCLLSFVGCKEIKGATSSLHEIISLLSLSRHPQWLLLSVIPLGSCSTIQRWCSNAKRCHPWCQWISLTICHRLSLC